MDVVFLRCAGVAVHKKSITACRIAPDLTGQEAEGIAELRTFDTMTLALLASADWLTEARIPHVAMESTGEYWTPIYNLLEGTFIGSPAMPHTMNWGPTILTNGGGSALSIDSPGGLRTLGIGSISNQWQRPWHEKFSRQPEPDVPTAIN